MQFNHIHYKLRFLLYYIGVVGGISEMLMWFVECLDILLHLKTKHQLTLEKEEVHCGCLVSLVQE